MVGLAEDPTKVTLVKQERYVGLGVWNVRRRCRTQGLCDVAVALKTNDTGATRRAGNGDRTKGRVTKQYHEVERTWADCQ